MEWLSSSPCYIFINYHAILTPSPPFSRVWHANKARLVRGAVFVARVVQSVRQRTLQACTRFETRTGAIARSAHASSRVDS